jgi:hypothetical protein
VPATYWLDDSFKTEFIFISYYKISGFMNTQILHFMKEIRLKADTKTEVSSSVFNWTLVVRWTTMWRIPNALQLTVNSIHNFVSGDIKLNMFISLHRGEYLNVTSQELTEGWTSDITICLRHKDEKIRENGTTGTSCTHGTDKTGAQKLSTKEWGKETNLGTGS